jgi:hypothetical protein
MLLEYSDILKLSRPHYAWDTASAIGFYVENGKQGWNEICGNEQYIGLVLCY